MYLIVSWHFPVYSRVFTVPVRNPVFVLFQVLGDVCNQLPAAPGCVEDRDERKQLLIQAGVGQRFSGSQPRSRSLQRPRHVRMHTSIGVPSFLRSHARIGARDDAEIKAIGVDTCPHHMLLNAPTHSLCTPSQWINGLGRALSLFPVLQHNMLLNTCTHGQWLMQ